VRVIADNVRKITKMKRSAQNAILATIPFQIPNSAKIAAKNA